MQLLRDTAQPRIFERSRSGNKIVQPENVFVRGAIFRGGPDDSVEFIGAPPIPIEMRSTQLDLEAMMQRGGVNWSMYGNIQGQLTSYVMSQISASAHQLIRPFHDALQFLFSDIDTAWINDIKMRRVKPYGWEAPVELPADARVSADYDIEIPGDLVQRATTARMLDPEFQLSFTYVLNKLFPDIRDKNRELAQQRADKAERNELNSVIALVRFYNKQASELREAGDVESARLYDMAATTAMGLLGGQQPQPGGGRREIGQRAEGFPKPPVE